MHGEYIAVSFYGSLEPVENAPKPREMERIALKSYSSIVHYWTLQALSLSKGVPWKHQYTCLDLWLPHSLRNMPFESFFLCCSTCQNQLFIVYLRKRNLSIKPAGWIPSNLLKKIRALRHQSSLQLGSFSVGNGRSTTHSWKRFPQKLAFNHIIL